MCIRALATWSSVRPSTLPGKAIVGRKSLLSVVITRRVMVDFGSLTDCWSPSSRTFTISYEVFLQYPSTATLSACWAYLSTQGGGSATESLPTTYRAGGVPTIGFDVCTHGAYTHCCATSWQESLCCRQHVAVMALTLEMLLCTCVSSTQRRLPIVVH